MREYLIRYVTEDGIEGLVSMPSFWKLLFWMIRKAWKCRLIVISLYIPPAQSSEEEDPCEFCVRWDECNGVDREVCCS